VPLQTQLPPTHERPLVHAGLPPHVHPPAVHESAVVGSHTVHAPASPPHVAREGDSQLLLRQHPLAHELALHEHAPFAQTCPAAQVLLPPQVHTPPEHESSSVGSHVTHDEPAVPQAVVEGVVQLPD
jgi:hypothetical protein